MKHLPETFIKARKEAALGQTRAAAKMTRRTKKMLIPLQIGQNCTLRVPDVDRGPADPKNFLVVVMAECEGLYTVGCREGKLASKFTAADLQVISENILSIDEVPDTEIPLRTAVTKATGGQGYVKCMCLSGCSSGRCSCSRKRTVGDVAALTATAAHCATVSDITKLSSPSASLYWIHLNLQLCYTPSALMQSKVSFVGTLTLRNY
ncbi:hypothetical protein T02_13014 [Trichinella nativa]|uniref:Uncharacterized protein n=1 Tax=Trichinella nativa TaxID=6335 RepID=A0A0V1L1E7_9BILA|nr:hypothetical protein T02_13014 [Trichinella nativa]